MYKGQFAEFVYLNFPSSVILSGVRQQPNAVEGPGGAEATAKNIRLLTTTG